MANPHSKLAGILLAAGGSTRLGRPKQLCEWHGKALVRYALDAVSDVCDAGIVVVTGAAADQVVERMEDTPVELAHNADWADGMAGSIRQGIAALDRAAATGVLITLCDQPLVTAADLALLAEAWQARPEHIAAAGYNDSAGVPAIFPEAMFDELTELQGDEGARKLLRARTDISIVAMPAAGIDIDTQDDLDSLMASGSNPE